MSMLATPQPYWRRYAVPLGMAALVVLAAGAGAWLLGGLPLSPLGPPSIGRSPVGSEADAARPVFRFELFTAGQDQSRQIATLGWEPWIRDQRLLRCPYYVSDLGGATGPQALNFLFYDNRLAAMIFSAKADNYAALASALQAKYGRPCQVGRRHWVSPFGATLDTPALLWCFASGRLALMPSPRGTLDLIYVDTKNRPSPVAPVVNF